MSETKAEGSIFDNSHVTLATRCEIAEERVRVLEGALASLLDVLDDARSGYIGGSSPDLQWDARKQSAVTDARAALATATTTVECAKLRCICSIRVLLR